MSQSLEKPINPLLAAYGRQHLDGDDLAAVHAALQSDYLTTGPAVTAFEEALSEATTAPAAVACSSGTAALHLAFMALGIGAGDSVIVPSVTFVATANAVRMCGGDVVFADVDAKTGLLTPETTATALQKATNPKAIVAVHLNGQSCDLEPLAKLANQHGCKLVTDACHALGGTYHDTKIGACIYEDMATFSFHPVKAITTGEGGAVTCKAQYTDTLKALRSHGLTYRDDGVSGYEQTMLGYNYRLSDIQCALGVTQLAKLPEFIEQRAKLAAIYTERLQELPLAQAPVLLPYGQPAWHLYALRLAKTVNRTQLRNQLQEFGIGSQVHYQPVHTQPYYHGGPHGTLSLPGAEHYADNCLSLPLHPQLNEADIHTVCDVLVEILGEDYA